MSNVVLFFLTRTQAAPLKGGNVSFELAGERWLTLMQKQKWEGGWEKRKRLERKAERERCAVKTEGKKGERAAQRRRGIRRKRQKNIRAQAGGEQERRAAGVRLNILSVWFPTGGCWINRTVCDNVLLHPRHLLPLPCSNQPQLVNTPAAGSSLRSDRASRNCGNTQRTWRAEEVPGRHLTA